MNHLTRIYDTRFRSGEKSASSAAREKTWKIFYSRHLKKYISPEMSVLDLGSGPGYFINRVKSATKIAVDLDPNNQTYLSNDTQFINARSHDLRAIDSRSIDLVFTSNLFEHLGSTEVLLNTLTEVNRVLKNSEKSKLIILMPNIRYVKWDFYNFIDHNLPLNEATLKEALELTGFEIQYAYKKFLPYSGDNLRINIPAILIETYLLLPARFRPMAKQMFFVASPKISS